LQAFFFPTGEDLRLLGVWRGNETARRAWILCPPFAEEEKSARRVLTLLAQLLESRDEASLLFSFRGTGDSEGDFAGASLSAWREDLRATHDQVKKLAPNAEIALLGVRLGASLALLEAEDMGAKTLVLVEPLLSGRSFLMQQGAKKQIRAQLTGESQGETQKLRSDDLDGWQLGSEMKAELSSLDLARQTPSFSGKTHVFGVGPRPEAAPPLQNFAGHFKTEARAVVMPPFWNLIDYSDPAPLLKALQKEVFDG
jgi:alpha/beta superfamily hydrolase